MQQLLVTVLAVHLMSVVAGPGRAGAAPVQHQQQPPFSTSTTRPPSRHHLTGHRHKSHAPATSDLSPWTVKQQMSADSRRERSLGVWGHTRPQKFLTSKHGWTLEILPNGSVTSTREPKPRFGILQTEGVDRQNLGLPHLTNSQYNAANNSMQYGKVAILGFHSSRYLCMGKNGHMYTRHRDEQVRQFSQECVFVEKMRKHFYYTYCSYKFPKARTRKDGTIRKPKKKWCLGINRNGTVRLGKRTKERHSFAQFTPRPAEPPPSTPFPVPRSETTTPVRKNTVSPPSHERPIIGPTESPKPPRPKPTRKRPTKNCNGPGGLFNIRCRDDDVVSDVTELKRKSSRRRSRGRSRKSKKRNKKNRREPSRVKTIGLFNG